MGDVLGILAATDDRLDHLLGLTRAAVSQGKEVIIFFTGRGVRMTRRPGFEELAPLAEMSLCRVSLERYGLEAEEPVPGIPFEDFGNQSRHADLIERADRYVVL